MEIKALVLGRHRRRCWLRRKSNLTFDKTQRVQNIVVHFSVGRTDEPTDVVIAGAFSGGNFLTLIDSDFRAPQKTTGDRGEVSDQNKTGGIAVTVQVTIEQEICNELTFISVNNVYSKNSVFQA